MGEFDFDFVVVGSGFGGSVSALRLSEKGYSVCVLERGRRFVRNGRCRREAAIARAAQSLRRHGLLGGSLLDGGPSGVRRRGGLVDGGFGGWFLVTGGPGRVPRDVGRLSDARAGKSQHGRYTQHQTTHACPDFVAFLPHSFYQKSAPDSKRNSS